MRTRYDWLFEYDARMVDVAPRPPAIAPVQVMDGNYNVMRGICPWWDSSKG